MDGINLGYVVLFLLCLLLSAFFSSSETAYISLQRVRLRHLVDSGVARADEVTEIMRQPERLISAVLVGNNFVNTTAAALGTIITYSMIDDKGLAVIISTAWVTMSLLLFGEVIPKTVATRIGERMALVYIRPLRAITWILSPITIVLTKLGAWVAHMVGGSAAVPRDLITENEVRAMISMGREHGAMEEGEADIMERVFLLGDRRVAEIMKPRNAVVGVEKGTKMKDFLTIYSEAPHSRFPVYDESMDNVAGILSIKDILMTQAQGILDMDDVVTGLARPAYFVPETKVVGDLFTEMQAQNIPAAIVVDEYGGVAGLVTMEQVLEELVGKLGDEFAVTHKNVEKIDRNTYQVSGEMRITQANEDLGLGLPEGDYETLAGFVLSVMGHIPTEGEQFKHENLTITVTEMKEVKIEKVLITKG